MPAVTVLRHEAVVGELAEHAVEVVLRDARFLGDLGDGDSGAGGDDLERLLRAWPRALRAPALLAVGVAAASGDGRGCGGRGRAGLTAIALRRGGGGADPGEGGGSRFEARVLVAERLEPCKRASISRRFTSRKSGMAYPLVVVDTLLALTASRPNCCATPRQAPGRAYPGRGIGTRLMSKVFAGN